VLWYILYIVLIVSELCKLSLMKQMHTILSQLSVDEYVPSWRLKADSRLAELCLSNV